LPCGKNTYNVIVEVSEQSGSGRNNVNIPIAITVNTMCVV